MNKKLYVPEHVLRATKKEKLPKPIENAFKNNDAEEDNKNVEDPSNLEASALERLPQPTGYRVLIIPYYPSAKQRAGCIFQIKLEIVSLLLPYLLTWLSWVQTLTKTNKSSLVVPIVRRKVGFL